MPATILRPAGFFVVSNFVFTLSFLLGGVHAIKEAFNIFFPKTTLTFAYYVVTPSGFCRSWVAVSRPCARNMKCWAAGSWVCAKPAMFCRGLVACAESLPSWLVGWPCAKTDLWRSAIALLRAVAVPARAPAVLLRALVQAAPLPPPM